LFETARPENRALNWYPYKMNPLHCTGTRLPALDVALVPVHVLPNFASTNQKSLSKPIVHRHTVDGSRVCCPQVQQLVTHRYIGSACRG